MKSLDSSHTKGVSNMSKESHDIKTDLHNVASILRRYGICNDVSPLERASGAIKDFGTQSFRYSVSNLKFNNVPIPRNIGFNSISTFVIYLDVALREKYLDMNEIGNPIIVENTGDNFLFCLRIECMNRKTKHVDSWHLDYEPEDNKEYVHPMFHLTHGGRSMDGIEVGQSMKLVVPRLPFYPMDAILGIDFIVGNFYKKDTYNKLRSEHLYIKALKNAQNRLWRPYFLALSHIWCTHPSIKMDDLSFPSKLSPYIVLS